MAARIVVMAGGTGGHVFPALAVAKELRGRGWEVSWIGTPDSFEARVVPEHGFPIDLIDAHRLRGQGLASLLLAPFRLLKSMLQAGRVLRQRDPLLVLGMGGFVTAPGGFVSRLLRLPLVIHEQNAIPGMTNRWLSRIATRTLEAFPGSFDKEGVEVTGNPVRREIIELAALLGKRQADHEGNCRVLVVGGSLGAAALNETVPAALAELAEGRRPEVRHQAGRDKLETTRGRYEGLGVEAEVTEFVNDMAEAYAWADLVICRAGALTVAELAAAGVASVLVPYPHAVDDHQTHNARYLSDAGAGVLLLQNELSPRRLAALLGELCADRDRLKQMAKAARRQAKPDSAQRVADICESLIDTARTAA